ncbi:MAG: outer membrane beta-barrel protein [Deinococcales bacterium]|nr:outer membrane beta-barrel protein [Chitinophagaceae bacterium]
MIIATATKNGFQTFGLSSNFDYEINNKLKFRIEGKLYNSKDKIFMKNTSNNNYSLTTNLTFKL